MRPADRVDFPALRPDVDGVRQVRSGVRIGRDCARRRDPLALWLFVVFDAIGAALWVGVGVGLGFLFRDAIGRR
jgi:hypothetical protein